ncbi:MAG: septum formation protein Maf [Clostridia bacterium]|nr:septum formation protein Maf [Clostridia bacterium]
MKIILASGSPRRRELLEMTGLKFDVVTSDADESVPEGTDPAVAALMLSERKALAVARLERCRGCVVIGADTIVSLDGQTFGKPKDDLDAYRMLMALSDRTHTVYTGVSIVNTDLTISRFVESTEVHFYPLSHEQIRDYIATGEYSDKAGSYAIQGGGAVFISGIIGDYYNVMGLPIGRLMQEIRKIH